MSTTTDIGDLVERRSLPSLTTPSLAYLHGFSRATTEWTASGVLNGIVAPLRTMKEASCGYEVKRLLKTGMSVKGGLAIGAR